jgi:hypothetical protein
LAELDPAFVEHAKAQNALRSAVENRQRDASTALERDFRDRIASGDVVLGGLQFAPTLATARSTIPSVWARLLSFWVPVNKVLVGVQKIRFMEVTAHRAVPPVSAAVSSATPASADTEAAADPSPRRRGRASSEPLIEADLRANWEAVQQRVAKTSNGEPNWSDIARFVRNRLMRARGPGQVKVPQLDTIRRKLPRMYAQLLGDKLGRK